MWPEQMRSSWERANYAHSKPDCEHLGSHRFGMIHLLPEDKSVQYRSCKRCGLKEFVRVKIIDDRTIGELRLNIKSL